MKKLMITAAIAVLTIFATSCSSDDPVTTKVTATDLTASVDENSDAGTLLGTLEASSNTGTVTYTIISQSIDGALAVDTTTGKVTIADADAFDFETNPVITADVDVADGNVKEKIKITINLNDVDNLDTLLSTSKTTYKNAKNGDWIEITEAEYNNLATKLDQTIRVGTTEDQYNNYNTSTSGAVGYTRLNYETITPAIPANSYVFAFKVKVKQIGRGVELSKVKVSNKVNSDFVDLGNELKKPQKTGSIYYILKGNTKKFTEKSYLAFYNTFTIELGSDSTFNYYYGRGDVSSLPSRSGYLNKYQGLSTTKKHW